VGGIVVVDVVAVVTVVVEDCTDAAAPFDATVVVVDEVEGIVAIADCPWATVVTGAPTTLLVGLGVVELVDCGAVDVVELEGTVDVTVDDGGGLVVVVVDVVVVVGAG
jgi:hypothetical protein